MLSSCRQDMKVTQGTLRADISAPVASSFPAQTEKAHLDVPNLILPYWCMRVTKVSCPLEQGSNMQAGSYNQSLMLAVLKQCLGIVWGEGITGASQNVAGEDARSSAVRTRVRFKGSQALLVQLQPELPLISVSGACIRMGSERLSSGCRNSLPVVPQHML